MPNVLTTLGVWRMPAVMEKSASSAHPLASQTAQTLGSELAQERPRFSNGPDLLATLEAEIIPRLMMAHRGSRSACEQTRPPPTQDEIVQLAHIAACHDLTRALSFVETMCRDGLSLEVILLDLVAQSARPFRGPGVYLAPAAARLMAQSRLAAGVISLQARNAHNVVRLVRSTGSVLDDRGVELYQRLALCPGHVAGVLAMLAAWDLAPLEANLPRLDTPLLLLAGEHDGVIPLQQQRNLARHIHSARLRVVQHAGHLLHEERPAFISQLLLQETAVGWPLGGSGVVH
jgi:pimeloyl-ACP methyl ester carboxylesterase